jgi:crotonobetainyl-CoA:carnitine CoA-transferase CaiB-like acyl-CoA transferase
MSTPFPLAGVTVADLSSGIAGAYCAKTLVDAGAAVVKLEPPDGDPLRRQAVGRRLGVGEDGALFQFLASGFRSVVVDPADPEAAEAAVAQADAVLWSPGTPLAEHERLQPGRLQRLAPHAPVVSITPFGLDGPWAGRPWSELTLQAWGGGVWHRGDPDRAPVMVGGRLGEWAAGAVAAIGLLLARETARRTGAGQLVDVSILESIALTHTGMYPVTFRSVAGRPFQASRRANLPGIEPTKDGWVGFMVVTGQQWQDFCVVIGRPEWMDDADLAQMNGRQARAAEVRAAIREYTTVHTTAEVIEQATLLRVPVAPLGDGATVTGFDHFVERKAFVRNARGGFLQPAPPYRLPADRLPADPPPPPLLGEHTAAVATGRPVDPADTINRHRVASGGDAADGQLPLAGLRVADFTMFWAGPIVGSILAAMGAEVIHVESPSRPDGMRFMSAKAPPEDGWWEWGPLFMAGNTNKLGVTLDLNTERGGDLAIDLVRRCDVVLENFSPRVMDGLGLGWKRLSAVRPDLVMVRMSAFGLDGPWRDRTGYAQTQEQVSGMASVTGWPDREPMVPNGPCDPLAGLHATIATLVALEHRRCTGDGVLVDVPMVGSALNVTAEVSIEWSAYGHLLGRLGNHSPIAAPHDLYRTAERDSEGRQDCWVAIAVTDDDQWRALQSALGHPAWAAADTLGTAEGRLAAVDALDAELAAWCSARSSDEIVDALWAAGVPVGRVVPAHEIEEVPQLQARGYFETLDHPVAGRARYQGFPARLSRGPAVLHRAPSPTLGRDNAIVLGGLLGLSADDVADLAAAGVIGQTLRTN